MEAIIQVTDLPPEIIALILEYLDRRSINRFLTSSMKLNEIGAHPAITDVVVSKGTGILANIRVYRVLIDLSLYRKSTFSKDEMCSTIINLQGINANRIKRISNLLMSGKEIELKKFGEGYISSSEDKLGLMEYIVLSSKGREIVTISIDKIVLQRLLEETLKMIQNTESGQVIIFDDRTVFKSTH